MKRFRSTLQKFIEENKYLTNDNVLGIVVYGSSTTGFFHDLSDIDVHIIMNNIVKEFIRGAVMIDGFKIEYFEKPLYDLYESAENDFYMQKNALVPIIGYGEILFDRYGYIEKLQNYVLEIYKKPLPPLELNDAKEMAVIIGNRLSKLKIMAKVRRFDFDYQYHLLIEKIRKFYSRLCGCPDIPVTKAYKIYTDDDYREAFCHGKVPEEDFITLYFEAIGCQGDIEEKLEYATKLYEYTTRDLKINLNHYRIRIKSRNNPMNTNHE